jgi:hypothetical protein
MKRRLRSNLEPGSPREIEVVVDVPGLDMEAITATDRTLGENPQSNSVTPGHLPVVRGMGHQKGPGMAGSAPMIVFARAGAAAEIQE